MADVKISELPAASALVAGDLFPAVQDDGGLVTRKATAAQIGAYVRGLAGTVRQVVRATPGTVTGTTTSATYVDYGVNLNITPTSTSSIVLLFANFIGSASSSSNDAFAEFAIRTGSTLIKAQYIFINIAGVTAVGSEVPVAIAAWHSPATTSAVNYKISFSAGSGSSAVIVAASEYPVDLFALEVTQ